MKDLTTRKIVFGILMALVLAFSVPGVVEAISYPTTSHKHVADYTNIRQVNSRTTVGSTVSLNNSNSVESVTITPGTGVSLITPVASTTSVTLTERKRDENSVLQDNPNGRFFTTDGVDIGTSFKITVRFTSVGEGTVQIADATSYMKVDPDNRPNLIADTDRDSKKGDVTYTYYVAQQAALADRDSASITLAGGLNAGYHTGNFGEYDKEIYAGESTNHYLVTYKVTGGGQIYIERPATSTRPASKKSAHTTLTTSSIFKVVLDQNGRSGDGILGYSNMVTAQVSGSNVTTTGVYIHGTPTLEVDAPTGREKGSKETPGKPGEVIQNAFTATVKDERGRGVGGVVVKFGASTIGGGLIFDRSNSGTLVELKTSPAARFDLILSNNQPLTGGSGKQLYVRTNSSGKASVDYRLGSTGEQTVPVDVVGTDDSTSAAFTKLTSADSIKAYAGSKAGLRLSFFRIREGLSDANTFDLYALVEEDGSAPTPDDSTTALGESDYDVVFTTDDGTLTTTNSVNGIDQEVGPTVTERPNTNGIAEVAFEWDGSSSNPQVTAYIEETVGSVKRLTHEVTFNVTGDTTGTDTGTDTSGTTTTNAITISPATITGEPGDTVTITISNPAGAPVFLSSPSTADFPQTNFVPASGTTTSFTSTVTLPDREDIYTIFASTTTAGVTAGSATVTVATAAKGTLAISGETSGTPGSQITVTVTATDATGTREVGVDFTISAPSITTARGTTGANGIGRAIVTLPSAVSTYSLTAKADGYTDRPFSVTVSTTGQPTQQPTPTPTPTPTVSEPDSIIVGGPATRSGTVNEALEAPLLVQVLDADGDGFENAIVTFRVQQGRGRLSQRGDGLGVSARTDSQGFARANLTPLSAGKITVEAEARGVTETVTFTITTGLAPATIEPGTEDPMPSTTVSPVLNAGVPAASRPPMLWISGGKIYALVGSDVEVFIPTVENATNLAVGGGKVYWTAKTSDTHGTLNSANLDGTDAKQLRTVWGVPRGITLDPTGSKLYWVDAAGRLQRSNLDASGIENVIRGLSDPKHVALSDGNAYWIGNGSGIDTLSFTNLSDPRKEIRPIASTSGISSGIYGGLTIAGGKLYWTEQTSDTHGTLYSANLDGTGIKELPVEPIWGAPVGIAVDTARSRLYWTDAVGRLQRSNLDASGIHNVAKGLGRLGDLVISNSIAEPAGTTPTKTTPIASKSKYDVNEDGVVDNMDAGLVSEALNTTNAKYDVNDDGVVNFFDLLLVFDNRDADAAGAPPLLGMKLTAAQVAGIEEQIEQLIATGDRSPAAMRTLIYLQQLIVMARPEKTQLLANYPNPFNPETWIPYELATDTDVRITIYNAQGVVIRTLQLGQQSAGYYTDRERAAYWDGRNALGEQVASGVYFYQFETDEMSSMRKMVILK